MTASTPAPPAPPVAMASGLGGGGGFRSVEEYLDHLRSYGVERFPFAGHEEGVHLDAATAVLGHALAHFVDTYRTLHADGYRGAIASVKALLVNAPAGHSAEAIEREAGRLAHSLAILPTTTEPTPSEGDAA